MAVAAVQACESGVYIAMNGQVFPAGEVRKNREENRFEKLSWEGLQARSLSRLKPLPQTPLTKPSYRSKETPWANGRSEPQLIVVVWRRM